MFLFFQDGANRHSRGRFELAFSQIGGSVMIGAAIGGLVGGWNGLKTSSNFGISLKDGSQAALPLSATARRSQLLNYIIKTGAMTANTFGVISLLYSAIGVGLSFINENNDDYNTIGAATLTGFLYRGLSLPKTSSGSSVMRSNITWPLKLKRSVVGGLMGLTASTIFILIVNRDQYFRKNSSKKSK